MHILKNLFDSINILLTDETPDLKDPCSTSYCGPNSKCRVVNNVGVCSCLPEYVGSPPACRPECVSSSECVSNKACMNQKCVNPCPAACGRNSNCRVINHSPHCTCVQGFTGDPFTVCFPMPRKFLLFFFFFFFFNFIRLNINT